MSRRTKQGSLVWEGYHLPRLASIPLFKNRSFCYTLLPLSHCTSETLIASFSFLEGGKRCLGYPPRPLLLLLQISHPLSAPPSPLSSSFPLHLSHAHPLPRVSSHPQNTYQKQEGSQTTNKILLSLFPLSPSLTHQKQDPSQSLSLSPLHHQTKTRYEWKERITKSYLMLFEVAF